MLLADTARAPQGLHSTFAAAALAGPLLVLPQQPQGEEEESESRATAPRPLQLQLEHRDSPGLEQWLGRAKWAEIGAGWANAPVLLWVLQTLNELL